MLLAVDTSTQWVGLALYDGVQVISEEVWQARSHHTVELSPALATLFKRSGVSMSQLRLLAVALGPGSFTSLRIGLGVVKGLALALHLPVIGVPTLDIQAASVPAQDLPLAAVLQAGRGRLAVGWYHSKAREADLQLSLDSLNAPENHPSPSWIAQGKAWVSQGAVWVSQGDARVMSVEELSQGIRKPTLVSGELSGAERQVLARKRKSVLLASPAHAIRRPGYLAEIAWQRWQAGMVDDVVTLAPIYLHIADPIPA